MSRIDDYIKSIDNDDSGLVMINLAFCSKDNVNDLNLQKLIDALSVKDNYKVAERISVFVISKNSLQTNLFNFSCMPNLKRLYLDGNFIESIDINNLNNLEFLFFNDTRIRYIDTNGLSNIQRISAYNTPLVTINFKYPLDIKYLDVIDTDLTHATKIALKALFDLRQVEPDNPFILYCNICGISEILTESILDSHFDTLRGLENVPTLKCVRDSMNSLLKIFGTYDIVLNFDKCLYSPSVSLKALRDYDKKHKITNSASAHYEAVTGTRANKRFHIC